MLEKWLARFDLPLIHWTDIRQGTAAKVTNIIEAIS